MYKGINVFSLGVNGICVSVLNEQRGHTRRLECKKQGNTFLTCEIERPLGFDFVFFFICASTTTCTLCIYYYLYILICTQALTKQINHCSTQLSVVNCLPSQTYYVL